MISVAINTDTRTGWLNDQFSCGEDDHIEGLHGVRSIDFMIDGVTNKMNFFSGCEHTLQCILYIDEHESLSNEHLRIITDNVEHYGNGSHVIVNRCTNKTARMKDFRWCDWLYMDALRYAEGDYIVHFDGDTNAFRTPQCNIVSKYINWLDSGEWKFVSQPTNMSVEDHGMWWASTRFLIYKQNVIDYDEMKRCMDNKYLLDNYPFASSLTRLPFCLEQTLGVMAGKNGVLYPDRQDDEYCIFTWMKYFKGTLRWLNDMPYHLAKYYLIDVWGMHGSNDIQGREPEDYTASAY